MIRLKPDLPHMPSQACTVVVMNDLERNILLKLLHHPVLDTYEFLNPSFRAIDVKRFREMAHELER